MPSPFLLIFLPVILSSVWACPPEQSIAPACICKDFGDGAMMICSNITSAEELVPYIKTTDSLDMFALTIMESTLLYIPSSVFKNTKYQKILFLNTQLMSLTDGDLAFEGLEDRLEELRAIDAHYITQWDWSQLRYHRLCCPVWQRELEIIDLSGNLLTSLPEDMFHRMPNLKQVELNHNKFVTLNEETFSWAFQHLQTMMFIGNDFRCDCRMKWIVDIKSVYISRAHVPCQKI
ncbi:g-protein coupled receptor GRL101 [Trichonephila inaurata madagascariensis]|uniref:G-protein coupled receptor GRL101 n=1 Tax=Trichonephila inaurata madagascariensis TaxID=2747483 RepID=A0A8X6XYQ4_9ARAC|nr:g-protein coupled receptor GRL101 [Trichonephila inaurata madagascariensis]